MTEEIIIDGVDVSECEKLGETIDGITCGLGKRIRFANEIITKHNLCEDNPNCLYKQLKRLEQENKELKEWKDKVVKLFESACRCKYLNEETDICSYTNEKCININKCVYKYQELSGAYRSALDTIQRMVLSAWEQGKYLDGGLYNDLINEFAKINEVLNENKSSK